MNKERAWMYEQWSHGQIDLDIVDLPYQEDTSDLAPIIVEDDDITHPLNDTSGRIVDVDMGLVRIRIEEDENELWDDSENDNDIDEDDVDDEILAEDDDI